MRRSILMVGVLAGCASLTGREPGKSQGPAGAESFHCSQRVVRELGYAILDIDHGAEYLRATRNFGQENGSEYVRGYLTVLVEPTTAGRRLLARGERLAEGTGIALPPRRDPPTWPPGRPPAYDTTDHSGRFRPRGARRMPAGATGAHARQVVRVCGRTGAA